MPRICVPLDGYFNFFCRLFTFIVFLHHLSSAHLTDSSAAGFSSPFCCCQLHHFLQDPAFLTPLQDELLELDFTEKNNDLYKFRQTADLGPQKSPHVSGLRRLLTGGMLSWLREVTGIPLTDRIDMGCSRYELSGRAVRLCDVVAGGRFA